MSVNKTLLKWLAIYMAIYTAFSIFWMLEGQKYSVMKGDMELNFLTFSFLLQYAFVITVAIIAGWKIFLRMLFVPPAILLAAVITSFGVTELVTKNAYDQQVLFAYTIVNGIFFAIAGLLVSFKVNTYKS